MFRLSIVGRSILSSKPQVPWRNSQNRAREDESLFPMALRVLAHGLKSAPFWPVKTMNRWVNRRTDLTWHPVTSFYFRTTRKYCMVDDFRQTPIFGELVFSGHCKQHKWWSYVKTFWVELCYQNVKLQLAAPEICQAKNLSSKPRIENTEIRQNLFNLPNLSCVNLLFRITAKIKTKVSFITDPSWFQ